LELVWVANLPSRIYWHDINGDPMFFFRGNTAALNQALEAFCPDPSAGKFHPAPIGAFP
jgi:hypothetical protein